MQNRLKRYRFLLFGLSSVWIIGCGEVEKPTEVRLAEASLPAVIDFNYHIKPILSDRCFACHGPDKKNQKGGLRLDIADSAYAALKSGAGVAIEPGSLKNSQVYHRLITKDSAEVMPPPESNLVLTTEEIAYLTRWIEQGAEYKPHWAFSKPVKKEVPKAGKGWAINEIDAFVAAKLEPKNIKPSPPSRREVLVRRLYFDLTGLPPSAQTVKKIIADKDPNYYEKLVDQLLASPAYGERMAAHWMDVARFADSEGYLDDFHHAMWPYRDWVINSFNKNLPYKDFILWQVGGDQIPGAKPEQRLATAFNRLHKQNSEGGAIPEEFRVEYVADRTNTIGTAFMGLTVGCARCHDHKYDPISQKDYYQLFSFFNSTVERGDGIFAFNGVENGNRVPNKLAMNAGPVMPLSDAESTKLRAFLQRQITGKAAAVAAKKKQSEQAADGWLNAKPDGATLEKTVEAATMVNLTFDQSADGVSKDLATGSKDAKYRGMLFAPGKKGQALHYDTDELIGDGSRISFEKNEPFTVSFWIKTPKKFNEARVFFNGNSRLQGYRGWEVVLDSTRLCFRLNHAHPYQSIDVRMTQPLPLNTWQHYVWTYDGSGKAAGMKVYRNGQLTATRTYRDYLYRSAKPYTDKRATVYMPYKGLVLGRSHYDQTFGGGYIDELRVLNKEAGQLVASYLYDQPTGRNAFEKAIQTKSNASRKFYALHVDQKLEQERQALRDVQLKEIMLVDSLREIMVMGDSPTPRPTYLLERGSYEAYGKRVDRDVPNAILPWPKNLPRNRYGLGQWLIHPDNPLTARVAVNQFWYLLFGRGLVKTNEDFGNQGALPTHPELLDWLAVDFQQHGWDVKRLVRQMVTSATYRQSSVIRKDLQEIDPDNNLLARSPRYRLPAEMVRDNALSVSGLLNRTVGGESAFPYQPAGLWKETITSSVFPEYKIDTLRGLYRRSLYTFWKRSVPPPTMLVFDASTRGECQVKRQQSNTPLQSLVLLNSPQMVEASRVLAERVWRETASNLPKAVDQLFLTLVGRLPTPKEQEIVTRQYRYETNYFAKKPLAAKQFLQTGNSPRLTRAPDTQIAALAVVASTLMNSTEGYYKN